MAREFVSSLGKTVPVWGFPGFMVNRFLLPMITSDLHAL